MNMIINGTSLFVDDKGTGSPALVFLHYWGGTHRTFNSVIANLEGPHRTVTYDRGGWGQSEAARGYSIVEAADDVIALVDALKLDDFVLVGHSMGGKIAQLAASRRPRGLHGLVLAASAMPTPMRFPEEMKQLMLQAYQSREGVMQSIDFLCAHTPDPGTVDQIVEDCMSGTPEARRSWPASASLEDISENLSGISVPTLVLVGEHDHVASIEQHQNETVARIEGSRLRVIKGSGHLIPVDEPSALAHEISSFVRSLHP